MQACWICGVEIDEDATTCFACSVADVEELEIDDLIEEQLELG